MNFYRIIGVDGSWGLINVHRVVFVDFDETTHEIVFDSILRIKVDQRDYTEVRRDLLRKMFKVP